MNVTFLRAARAQLKLQLDAIADDPTIKQRGQMTEQEDSQFRSLVVDIKGYDAKIAEAEEAERRNQQVIDTRNELGIPHGGEENVRQSGGFVHSGGGETYQRGDRSVSFFRDLRNAKLGDSDAAQRLSLNEREQRALGNTNGVGGSGGEFAPPAWAVADFVAYARAARVTADLLTKDQLPSGVSSINIPKVLTGASTAVQTTQNTAAASVDPTTAALTSNIVTIAGKNVVSQQLIDQSAVPFDQMVLKDLSADYARSLDLAVLAGPGGAGQINGLLTYFTASGTANFTYTQATPAVAGAGGLYSAINHAISNIATTRFLPPTAIVMHPRRWSYVAAAFDGQNRPLVSPSGNAFNQVADASTVAAQGPVGSMAGLPVYVDPNLPVNLGAGTNQDPILVGRFEDVFLWESGITMATFDQPYADSLGVLLRVHGYTAMIPSRYASSVAVITGTGLVTPSY